MFSVMIQIEKTKHCRIYRVYNVNAINYNDAESKAIEIANKEFNECYFNLNVLSIKTNKAQYLHDTKEKNEVI